ncbi:hypothetical protein [Frankia sp. AgB32]|uniref:hypothetical protein n=1 Tax=Frankia sp. AgB32 TaxID=631119 RepID=UPI00200E2284|nr:hypothetical protein [Frankia sp. AgB32]MCK9896549.1 hypothetical protein [Frankia sp. AgB32]
MNGQGSENPSGRQESGTPGVDPAGSTGPQPAGWPVPGAPPESTTTTGPAGAAARPAAPRDLTLSPLARRPVPPAAAFRPAGPIGAGPAGGPAAGRPVWSTSPPGAPAPSNPAGAGTGARWPAGYGGHPAPLAPRPRPGGHVAPPGFGGPAAGWGGPGWTGGPPPPPRRAATRWLVPLALVLAVAVGAGALGVVLLGRSGDGSKSAVRSYLTDVRAGRYDAAYGRLCDSVRSRRSAAEYAVIMRAFDGVRGNVARFSVLSVQTVHPTAAQTVREVQVTVQRGQTAASQESYEVGKESGGYCVLTPGAPFTGSGADAGSGQQQPGPFSGGGGGGSGGTEGGLGDSEPARPA